MHPALHMRLFFANPFSKSAPSARLATVSDDVTLPGSPRQGPLTQAPEFIAPPLHSNRSRRGLPGWDEGEARLRRPPHDWQARGE